MVPLVPVAGEGLLLGLVPLGVLAPLEVLPPRLPLPDELPPMVPELDGVESGAAPEEPLPIELLPVPMELLPVPIELLPLPIELLPPVPMELPLPPVPIELLPELLPGGQFTELLPELLVAPVGGQSAALAPELVLPVPDAPELPMPLLPDEDGMPEEEGELGVADGLVAEGLVDEGLEGLVAEGLLP